MAVTPFPVSRYFGEFGELQAQNRTYPSTGLRAEGGYVCLVRRVWIDLTKRREIGILDYMGSDVSEVTWTERRVIKDVQEGIRELNFRHATSGPMIIPFLKPEGAVWRPIKEPEHVVYNPFIELLRENEFFRSLIEKEGAMNSYYMTVPVRDIGEQEIAYILKYYNAFQGGDFEWAGFLIEADTEILIADIAFPEVKQFRTYKTYVKRQPDAPRIEISNPEIKKSDGSAIQWIIRSAKKGEKYYIQWSW